MKIQDILWLEKVEDKIIRKHSVWPEVEQVLEAYPHIRFMGRGHRSGEDLYAAFGQTTDGRYLSIYFILKQPASALIVTARDMTDKERRKYGTK